MRKPTVAELARTMDHTLLNPAATRRDIDRLVEEALRWGVAAVCVQPTWVSYVREKLAPHSIRVASVIAFPHGVTLPEVKAFEAQRVVEAGADELDMVMHVGWARDGRWDQVRKDIEGVVQAAQGHTVKVILETGLLSQDEKIKAAHVVFEAGAHYVKTSTGYGPGGATVEDVTLLAKIAKEYGGKVKASGGIRHPEQALALLEAGAHRLGLSRTHQVLTAYAQQIEEGKNETPK